MENEKMKYFAFDNLVEKVYYLHQFEDTLILVAISVAVYMVVSLFLIFDRT